ncbi:MAG: hypothetical protein BZY80_01610 [SAR202 cluster bacterium Io17-Chloro-G2]|nr:MAG: hypothetical protein BZY80_01610 [SAR202 cluster bacterium Io17-Chloro-G2]
MSNPSVLVIDDDFAVRGAINVGLRLEGYDLLFAENGADALEVLKEATPRVVILDLKMPVMDGLEFLSNLQLKPSDPISVVVLTGYVDNDSAEACYRAGVSALVKKPFTLNELRGAVQTAIACREHSQLFKEMLMERVSSDVIQEKISQRLEVLGKYLQELAQVRRKASNPSQDTLRSDSGGVLDLSNLDGPRMDAGSSSEG